MEWISLKNTNDIGIGIINIHYDIASVMFATETETETARRATHPKCVSVHHGIAKHPRPLMIIISHTN